MNVRKSLLITAFVLILAGGAIFLFALSSVGFDFGKLSGDRMREYTLCPEESFSGISALLGDCDFTLKQASDGKTRVEIRCPDDSEVEMSVDKSVLKLSYAPKDHWFRHISFFSAENASVILYLPDGPAYGLSADLTSGDMVAEVVNPFGSVSVRTVSGDISWNGAIRGETFNAATSSGDVSVSRVCAAELWVSAVSGDVSLYGCEAEGALSVRTTSGEITLQNTKAETLACHTASGDTKIEIAGLRGDVILSSISGEMMLGDLVTDGSCQISTTSGDVHFVRDGASRFDVETVSGSVTGSLLGAEAEVQANGSASNENWKVTTTSGYVHIFPVPEE